MERETTLQKSWKKTKKQQLWNNKVTVIAIIIGALSTVNKGLILGLEDLEIRGRVETIQTTALLRSVRLPRKVLETCCHLNQGENHQQTQM